MSAYKQTQLNNHALPMHGLWPVASARFEQRLISHNKIDGQQMHMPQHGANLQLCALPDILSSQQHNEPGQRYVFKAPCLPNSCCLPLWQRHVLEKGAGTLLCVVTASGLGSTAAGRPLQQQQRQHWQPAKMCIFLRCDLDVRAVPELQQARTTEAAVQRRQHMI